MQHSFLRLATALLLTLAGPCSTTIGQFYNPGIDVRHYTFSISVNDRNDRITGLADITVAYRMTANSCWLDLTAPNSTGKGMTVSSVKEGGKPTPFTQEKDHLVISAKATAGTLHTYSIAYSGIPADGLIIAENKYGHRGFFGDNWPNRAHNWLPCVDHPSDKAPVEFFVTAPDHYQVVANGALVEEKPLPDHIKQTHWNESQPLSPKVMVIGIADFAIDHPGDTLGIPVYNYVYKEDKEVGFHNYATALKILPFYISHIGPYPFEKCGNVQSKTRFGGLENASAIFYYENSVSSPGIESLMAHEIAHQWFGDATTETEWQHLWLSEGFATYMTHCYLENRYGADTLARGMEKDRAQILEFEKNRMTPIVDTSIKDDYMQLLNPNSYQKGGWVLHMLRRQLGDSLFWKGISAYYTTYRNQNASSSDLEKVMEKVSGQDLHTFFHQWLDRPGHPSLLITSTAGKLDIVQQQPQPYEFPFEYSVNSTLYKANIKDKHTVIDLPEGKIVYDPNCNLLFTLQQ